ncbi:hypothetical protein SAMN05421849_1574 [Pontibaca methylaminivorans]|uniref:Uncharacterized protein n=1 Tax=Pontibaca methylaminivorans TaxID=515897 RepID=A0A1R3WU05_9RHOB|nr:hypothetical protein SAMN05421849_1574 [Pontibaca methylaminivorans]
MEWAIETLNTGLGQALIIAVFTAIAGRLLTARGKLIWSVSHQHQYQMPNLGGDGRFPVLTQQIWFQNSGRASIEDLEIVLNYPPQHFEIWSPRQYTTSNLSDGRLVISIPNLSGHEVFTLSMIDTIRELPYVLNVRWKHGMGKTIQMIPQRVWPPILLWCLAFLMLIGATAVLYAALRGIIWFTAL